MEETLPIFPLSTILFPYQSIDLVIFEDRYKRMLSHCQDSGKDFGVCLIKKGSEANGPLAEPYREGTTASIEKIIPYDQNRYFLSCRGRKRFRIIELLREEPFWQAIIEPLAFKSYDNQEISEFCIHISELLEEYAKYFGAPAYERAKNISQSKYPEELIFLCLSFLQVQPKNKQIFLDITDIHQFCKKLKSILSHNIKLLEIASQRLPITDGSNPFSLN